LISRSGFVDTWLGVLLFSTHPVICEELRQASSYLLRVKPCRSSHSRQTIEQSKYSLGNQEKRHRRRGEVTTKRIPTKFMKRVVPLLLDMYEIVVVEI
jgi:hypothetical protein